MRTIVFPFFLTSLFFNGISLTLSHSAIASLISSETINEQDTVHNCNLTVEQKCVLGLMSKRKESIFASNKTKLDKPFVTQLTQISDKQQKLPTNLATAVLEDAAKRFGLSSRMLRIENASRKSFANSCIFEFGKFCTREFKPIDGWEVTLRVKERLVNYRVNQTGTRIVLDPNTSL